MAAAKGQKGGGIIDTGDLRYFLRIASKNWYFVVVAVVLSAVMSYLYSYKIPEVYGASAQILLKDKDIYNYQNQVYQNIGYVAAYSDIVNQKRVLTSYDLIDKTLNKLDFDVSYYIIGRFKTSEAFRELAFTVSIDLSDNKLYEKPFDLKVIDGEHFELSYDPGNGIVTKQYPFNTDIAERDFLLNVRTKARINPKRLEELKNSTFQFVRHSRPWLVNKYKRSLTVENLEYTTILEVRVEDEVPERAKLFLDSLSQQYIDYTIQSEFDINENTMTYIDKQLDEVTVILNKFEDELEDYKENKSILDLTREQQMYFDRLSYYEGEQRRNLLRIETLNNLEDYVVNIGEQKLLPAGSYVADNDQFLNKAINDLYDMQMSRNRLLFDATSDNNVVKQLDETLNLNRMNLLIYIRNERRALEANNAEVGQSITDYEGLIRAIPRSERDILNIQRKLQVNEKLYMFLLEKRANTVIAKAGIIPQTKMIEAARVLGVVRPDKLKILYAFIVGGLVLSLLVVFVRVMFYDRVENAEQFRDLTALPIFGEIIASEKAEENYVVVDSDPKSAITESFRTIRTNLEYLQGRSEGGKVVLVTSYRPNEGKTFCSVNLAAILAKAGKQVLLLELDMHKPKVGIGLNMTSPTGMSNLLVGRATMEEVILPTQFENFHVILSGPTPPNASELVLSKRLNELLEFARHRFDYVLIDTPPVGLITDALVMMKHCDATLFVMNTRFANKDHVQSAIEVQQSNPSISFGFILNGVRIKRSKYYYNTNYGYGYRYAYGYGTGYGYGYGYGYGRRRSQGKGGKQKGGQAKDKPNT